MKRVTGIGGIFFKAKDAQALQAWYKRHHHQGRDISPILLRQSLSPPGSHTLK